MTKRIGIVAVFLVGCAVGGGASAFVVPEASAQQAATLTRWEHQCARIDKDELNRVGSRMGAEGWELAATSQQANGVDYTLCFKRPKL